MAKNKISEYSATPADNTDISNINIAEGCSPANVNNAIRSLMAQIKDLQAGTSGDTIPLTAGGTGATTASGARTNLSAAASGANSDITSLTGITAGTAASPTITTAGDTNTGMFFPAADTIAFAEGGTEAMRIDSSGNLGIGTTSPDALLTVNTIASFGDGAVGTPSIAHKGDLNTGIFFSAADTIDFTEGGTACGQFDSSGNFKFNSGYGSVATAYGCRAWVNFNGTGTPAIRASGNVTSITDTGVGTYTVNLTNAMPDANYSVSSIADDNSGNNPQIVTYSSATTSTLLLGVWQSALGRADPINCCAAIFR